MKGKFGIFSSDMEVMSSKGVQPDISLWSKDDNGQKRIENLLRIIGKLSD
jgi:hypothetical protein